MEAAESEVQEAIDSLKRANLVMETSGGRVALFRNQIAIQSVNANPFSAGGDSGSLIWHWASGVRPVALLFAGGGGTTFANPIASVFSALNIRLLP